MYRNGRSFIYHRRRFCVEDKGKGKPPNPLKGEQVVVFGTETFKKEQQTETVNEWTSKRKK